MLRTVADILECRGRQGWLVGGSVRDRMLGRYAPDMDVVVDDDASAVSKAVAAALKAPWFALSERYPTYRVLGSGGHIDVAAVRGGDILADLAQRDFTVNAMAMPVVALAAVETTPELATGLSGADALLDPFGGAAHLRAGRLVAVSDHIFSDDPLRLMRAVRFCHTLGLTMDDRLAIMVRQQASQLTAAAAERVVAEMCLTLAGGRAERAARLWDEYGLLGVVLPELKDSAAALSLLERLDGMLERPADHFSGSGQFLSERLAEPVDGAVSRPVALRLAGLTHTLEVEQVRAVGRRLKLSSALLSLLLAVSRGAHTGGREGGVSELLPEGAEVSREAVTYLWDAAPWEVEVLLVAAASEAPGALQGLMALAVERVRGALVPCPVDGEVLMHELGVTSGPALGRALREARLAWEAGEAKTAAEVLAVARAVVS